MIINERYIETTRGHDKQIQWLLDDAKKVKINNKSEKNTNTE